MPIFPASVLGLSACPSQVPPLSTWNFRLSCSATPLHRPRPSAAAAAAAADAAAAAAAAVLFLTQLILTAVAPTVSGYRP